MSWRQVTEQFLKQTEVKGKKWNTMTVSVSTNSQADLFISQEMRMERPVNQTITVDNNMWLYTSHRTIYRDSVGNMGQAVN